MSNQIIRKAFETRLKTWAAAQTPPIPVAFENAPFKAPAGRYVRAFVLPGQTDSRDLQGLHREFVGVLQASFVMPLNQGAREAADLVADLALVFRPSSPLTQDGLVIYMTKPLSEAPAIQEPDRYVVPASIFYKVEEVLEA